MNTTGLPDLLTAGRLASGVRSVNLDLARTAEELASGLRSDPVDASGGDPARLYVLEHDLFINQTRSRAIEGAKSRAAVTQAALQQIQNATEDTGAALIAAAQSGDIRSADLAGRDARSAFGSAVSALNARFGDRTLFSGAASTRPAIATPEAILEDILARVATESDAIGLIAAVDEYFADPAGYRTTGYLGADTDAPSAEIGESERISFALRADDERIIAGLSALALAAVAETHDLSADARLAIYREAGNRGIAATAEVISARADLGIAEERMELATIRLEASDQLLERSRSAIMARDPFEAATEFTALETQLQTMFSITARLSGLSLTNFLR